MSDHRKNFRTIIVAACMLSGLLAGGDVYRYVIEVPAWHHLDIETWATYSRHADLGNGIFLFPLEAILPAILLIIASGIILRNKPVFQAVALPIYLATIFALVGLGLTFFAAPIMLGLRHKIDEPAGLVRIFEQFHFWGRLRAVAQVLSFFGSVWSLGKLLDLPTGQGGR
jgi:hypothetical protein